MARENKLLGNFILDGIAPARRGMAKIEVSFDIDANGIVSVTAKDENTGKEQKITITASTNLTKEDVDRMVKEAESHAKDDERFKQKADLRNEADGFIYACEKHLTDFAGINSQANKSKAELLCNDLRQKIKDNADLEPLKRAVEDLKNHLIAMQQEAQNQAQAGAGAAAAQSNPEPSRSHNDSDVVDAEVV